MHLCVCCLIIMENKKRRGRISDDQRKAIIEFINNGHSYQEASLVFNLSYSTVWTLYNIYLKTGRTRRVFTGHRRELLSEEQKSAVYSWISMKSDLTLNQIKERIQTEWNLNISAMTIHRAIKAKREEEQRIEDENFDQYWLPSSIDLDELAELYDL